MKPEAKANTAIIHEVLEQVVNQKRIDAWDQFFSPDYIARGAPSIGLGFSRDTSGNKHTITATIPGGPAEGKLQVGDELLWIEDERQRWESYEDIPDEARDREAFDVLRWGSGCGS